MAVTIRLDNEVGSEPGVPSSTQGMTWGEPDRILTRNPGLTHRHPGAYLGLSTP